MFENEMPVEQHGFHFRQEIVLAIQITPACLHDADLRVGKILDGLQEEIHRRYEIGVEDRHELAGSRLEALPERAGFETFSIRAMVIFDRKSECPVAFT